MKHTGKKTLDQLQRNVTLNHAKSGYGKRSCMKSCKEKGC